VREIKFRAWDRATNKFITLELTGDPFEPMKYKRPEGHKYLKEMPNIVWQQCTGLMDRDGVEIYEGDIVQSDNTNYGKPFAVKWADIEDAHLDDDLVVGVGFSLFNVRDKSQAYKIIGNIYQNGDLLRK